MRIWRLFIIGKAGATSGSCLSHNGKNDSLQLAISRTQKGWGNFLTVAVLGHTGLW